ncbi:uncharacterized protein LOC114350607 [Ostrinia furnacalis]|uniref:uncharacterized protein LOC114350607 n=1 Tax=Ostrinia furnacalis TaxID=93504 RepID=UPI00103AA252|nr:uncharacterized protein LOC114350607 [Ostrinia furnacalis]
MKMDLTLFMLAFTMLWKSSQCVRCYKCSPEKEFHTSTTRLCTHFDASDAYIVECNSSTMCFKKITTLQLGNGLTDVTRSVERGCAAQTWDGDQRKVNGKWRKVNEIYEPYEESCKDHSGDERPTKSTECYCRGDLCNSASSLRICLALFIPILFLFLLS